MTTPLLTEAAPMLIEAAPCQYDDALVNRSGADVNRSGSFKSMSTTALYNGRSGKIRSESSSMISHGMLRPLIIRNRLANIEW